MRMTHSVSFRAWLRRAQVTDDAAGDLIADARRDADLPRVKSLSALKQYLGGIRDAQIDAARSRAGAAEATTQRLEHAAATQIVAADERTAKSPRGIPNGAGTRISHRPALTSP